MPLQTDGNRISFLDWLVEEKGFKHKSAKDVCSRYKRVLKIMDIDPKADCLDTLFFLSKKDAFRSLPYTVKSQIKRSVQLFHEFHQTNFLFAEKTVI